ncbi:hypothetical protein B9Z55_009458 [Caenorhabditis nigoni]|uniref:Uncharacterized protein n=1 Tax=Caenorhabditis nigoni TaxID=1611254 RepID=A0A2G5US61_9PELO|nr:hypothetical protein B9Z55_009458 [Caenorhabditis nigoni]
MERKSTKKTADDAENDLQPLQIGKFADERLVEEEMTAHKVLDRSTRLRTTPSKYRPLLSPKWPLQPRISSTTPKKEQ